MNFRALSNQPNPIYATPIGLNRFKLVKIDLNRFELVLNQSKLNNNVSEVYKFV